MDYLARVLTAPAIKLDAMLLDAKHDSGSSGRLHRALIESVPDYSEYNPAAATSKLRSLQAQHSNAVAAAIARVRLAEMGQEDACLNRLHKIVNIERSLDDRSSQ